MGTDTEFDVPKSECDCNDEAEYEHFVWEENPTVDEHSVHWNGHCPDCGREVELYYTQVGILDKETGEEL